MGQTAAFGTPIAQGHHHMIAEHRDENPCDYPGLLRSMSLVSTVISQKLENIIQIFPTKSLIF